MIILDPYYTLSCFQIVQWWSQNCPMQLSLPHDLRLPEWPNTHMTLPGYHITTRFPCHFHGIPGVFQGLWWATWASHDSRSWSSSLQGLCPHSCAGVGAGLGRGVLEKSCQVFFFFVSAGFLFFLGGGVYRLHRIVYLCIYIYIYLFVYLFISYLPFKCCMMVSAMFCF